jgi:hypothetical protein
MEPADSAIVLLATDGAAADAMTAARITGSARADRLRLSFRVSTSDQDADLAADVLRPHVAPATQLRRDGRITQVQIPGSVRSPGLPALDRGPRRTAGLCVLSLTLLLHSAWPRRPLEVVRGEWPGGVMCEAPVHAAGERHGRGGKARRCTLYAAMGGRPVKVFAIDLVPELVRAGRAMRK